MKSRTLIQHAFVFCSFASLLLMTSCSKEGLPPDEPATTDEPADLTVPAHSNARVPSFESLQTAGNGTFLIASKLSGKLMDVASASTADDANVLQWGGNGGTNQQWVLTQLTGGYYSIIGVQSGKALEVYLSDTADGGNISIKTYTGATNQQWQLISTSGGYYRIINRNSGKALDVAGQSSDDGANIDQWGYWGGDNQQWGLLVAVHSGQLAWTLTSTGVPSDVQTRITNAMNDAVARYNALYDWPSRTLTVEYNTGVATADGSTSGNIRFGPTASYQAVRTAMHEIGHTYGVGLSSGWTANISGGYFVGTNAVDMLETFDGSGAVINTGGGHFWPYGLNYDSEWSETNAYRHVKMVSAMVSDGM